MTPCCPIWVASHCSAFFLQIWYLHLSLADVTTRRLLGRLSTHPCHYMSSPVRKKSLVGSTSGELLLTKREKIFLEEFQIRNMLSAFYNGAVYQLCESEVYKINGNCQSQVWVQTFILKDPISVLSFGYYRSDSVTELYSIGNQSVAVLF